MASIITKGYGANQRIILQGYGTMTEIVVVVTPPPYGIVKPPKITIKIVERKINVYSDVSYPLYYKEKVEGSTVFHFVIEAKVWGDTAYKFMVTKPILGDLVRAIGVTTKVMGDYILLVNGEIVVMASTIQNIIQTITITGKKGFKKFMELLIEDE